MGKPLALLTQPGGKRLRRKRTVPTSTEWLSPKAAAEHIGVSVALIYTACASRGLPHAKVGHSTIRIRPAALDAWMEERAK
jgi:excisionase family DNA binding protein